MTNKVLLLTPPFTQLNTPYPATAYLQGFLNLKNIPSAQADLGIEVINTLFSSQGLPELFAQIDEETPDLSDNAQRILYLQDDYISTIDGVIRFLQGNNPTLAHSICQEGYLPEASRFAQLEEVDWAFGALGIQDKAKHIATLYLEDIADLITECVDPDFGFSRYAERLGRSANSFDELHALLQDEYSFIERILIYHLAELIDKEQPNMVAISIPFPGNLFCALRCGQWIKQEYPDITVTMGGGFANTELRSLSDARVFEYTDFITLDDGESPIEHLLEYIDGQREQNTLRRTFCLVDGQVVYIDNSEEKEYTQSETGTPDYSDLPLDKYISIVETLNPMHRLWSDGRWNKLTLAHGCYWGKCTFCDISLDYIKSYQPVRASLICDRMEDIIEQTGESGFHFVDEAAPPALMRDLALEILKRKLTVTWWTNIRFEKSFSRDLCKLLKASGCIAVSGGLEVASDRLLKLIDKGVTVEQVANVCRNFTDAGIMTHAYLMYGFPTQTEQETIDSLEMVRQLFDQGIIQSGFWHQFAMTAHSPVGINPEAFCVKTINTDIGSFANNDLFYTDPTGIDHDAYSYGLKKSLFNYMHGVSFDLPMQEWFEFDVPDTTIDPHFIEDALAESEAEQTIKPTSKVVWLGGMPIVTELDDGECELTFHDKTGGTSFVVSDEQCEWLIEMLQVMSVVSSERVTFGDIQRSYKDAGLWEFEEFWGEVFFGVLGELGVLVL
ncbi:B12-binding domain-containing radical SAM protein [Pseudomonadota bacterium]